MKRKWIALLLLLSLLLSFASCGDRITAELPVYGNGGSDDSGDDVTPDSGNAEGVSSTVTVMYSGVPYIPTTPSDPDNALKVRWTDGKRSYTKTLGEDGTASVDGLDGNYTVTLQNLPSGYTYNPNIYTVTNEKTDVQIELYSLTSTLGDGTGLYRCRTIKRTGYYRADISGAGQIVYYDFTPTSAGIYYVESLVDISADMYNPILKTYTGTTAAKFEQDEVNGGGASGSYTKNFRYRMSIAEEYLGHTFTFAVRVEGKDAVYPTYVDFSFTYAGIYEETFTSSTLIYREYDFEDEERFPDGYLTYLSADRAVYGDTWVNAAVRAGAIRVFSEDNFRLNPQDGFYHVYDEVIYAANGGWGPILYADITRAHIFSVDGTPMNLIEYAGNKALTVSEGTENYKLFIEGFAGVTDLAAGHNFFCDANCPCRKDNANGGGCLESANCSQCLSSCRPVPDRAYGMKGYADYVNEHGRVPVTEELKEFLQKFSESQRYFSDGNGWVESFGYTAFEDSQWLFCCGYYTE